MYDPIVGRWLEEDPDGFEAGDANLYRYVGNDPTNATDPSGLKGQFTTSSTTPGGVLYNFFQSRGPELMPEVVSPGPGNGNFSRGEVIQSMPGAGNVHSLPRPPRGWTQHNSSGGQIIQEWCPRIL